MSRMYKKCASGVRNKSFFRFYFKPDTWKDKDESTNKTQSCDLDMIRDEKRGEVEEEIRLQVDALMREELDLLKIVRLGMNLRWMHALTFGNLIWFLSGVRARQGEARENFKEAKEGEEEGEQEGEEEEGQGSDTRPDDRESLRGARPQRHHQTLSQSGTI